MKAYMLITIHTGQIEQVVEHLRRVDGVIEANMAFGPYDAVAVVEAEDIKGGYQGFGKNHGHPNPAHSGCVRHTYLPGGGRLKSAHLNHLRHMGTRNNSIVC
jgi:hypothetical protein